MFFLLKKIGTIPIVQVVLKHRDMTECKLHEKRSFCLFGTLLCFLESKICLAYIKGSIIIC